MSDNLLSVKELKTYFYTSRGVIKAVDDVNIEVGKNQAVGLVGESGSGKSVTARSIMGLVPNPPGRIVNGEIYFQGVDLLKLKEAQLRKYRGKDISIIFQDPISFLNPVMKIGDQLAEAIQAHQRKKPDREALEDILKLVGFSQDIRIWERYPHELSGGMCQRVLIAMALLSKPSLLIADEPTTALDVTIQVQILKLISNLRDELGMALLLITHDMGIMVEVCDYVYIMYAGKVMERGDVFSIFEKPSNPYTQGLLNTIPSIEKYQETLNTIKGTIPDLASLPPGCRFSPRCSKIRKICTQKEPPINTIDAGKKHYSFCWIGTKEYEQYA